ncbi:MAG TPA: lipid II flippase MurJ [Actinocrinis sp.]|uniref:murein biosynthesis integral membrane protein MurJ n=1 Tax=Actinocrinis sp. TaxID=1920516 RepID=UPI002D2B9E16|nr:lipid II flippase MurJ [Actinocrinis sp.]HZU57814.1 lipid II flippase MurJ [Actinocrinis sp.]
MPERPAPLPSVDDPLVQPVAPIDTRLVAPAEERVGRDDGRAQDHGETLIGEALFDDVVRDDTTTEDEAALYRAPAFVQEGMSSQTLATQRAARRRAAVRSVAGGAAMIAAVTVLSRTVGFLRTLAFSHTVGTQALADAYNTANQIPNTVFDIVAGGALASVAVPLLAGPLARGERKYAESIISALLTWTVAVLLPLSLVGIAISGPLGQLLAGNHAPLGAYAATVSRFLVLFLPQIPLYGVAVVLSATLQSDRRFLSPALAPLLSSLVVVTTYLIFGAFDPTAAGGSLGSLSYRSQLFLGLGTTLGVATLALSLLPAVRRTGLRVRPVFRFPPGVARRARHLAVAGVATLAAQNVVVLGVVLLTSHTRAATGSLTVYTFSWAVFVLPYAVLAVPIATTAFTDLAARADSGDVEGFRSGVATTSRAVLVAACGGAALLVATAWPMSYLFISAPTGPRPSMMAYGLLTFALGLPGYAAIAHLGRILYAGGHSRDAAVATVVGWLTVLAADWILIWRFPPQQAVAALGLGNACGMTVAGILLLTATRRHHGPGTFAGLPRAAAVGAIAAAAAGAAGWLVAGRIGPTGSAPALVTGVFCALVALVVFAAVSLALDDGDLRPLLSRAARWCSARATPAARSRANQGRDGASREQDR